MKQLLAALALCGGGGGRCSRLWPPGVSDIVVGKGGYPRGVTLEDGQWLVCVGMRIMASTDGVQFVQVGTVLADHRAHVDLGNCNLARLDSGRVLASYRHHFVVPDTGNVSYGIETSSSDDNGEGVRVHAGVRARLCECLCVYVCVHVYR